MSCFNKLCKKEKLVSRTLDIDEDLYYELEYLSKNIYDASISKLVNICIEELIDTEKIELYTRKNNSYISRSFLIRDSLLDGLYELKRKYRIPIYLLVNIAIRNSLIEENQQTNIAENWIIISLYFYDRKGPRKNPRSFKFIFHIFTILLLTQNI